MHIIALAACRNRRAKTVAAVGDLVSQGLQQKIELTVVLVDDGSSDGTREAITKLYPEVKILRGSGDLFWAGGMRYGWHAYVETRKFDALLVFNDDIRLAPDALHDLIVGYRSAKAMQGPLVAVAGAFRDPSTEEVTYGGALRSSVWHPLRFKVAEPSGQLQEVDTLNMNLALISYASLNKIGFLSDYFIHRGGDTEYGLKLRKVGGSVWLTPKSLGWCRRNQYPFFKYDLTRTLREQFNSFTAPKEEPVYIRYRFFREHGGFMWPILFLAPYIRIVGIHFLNRIVISLGIKNSKTRGKISRKTQK